MDQRFVDAMDDARSKGALKLVSQARHWCDHKRPNGKSARVGNPDVNFCDICGKWYPES